MKIRYTGTAAGLKRPSWDRIALDRTCSRSSHSGVQCCISMDSRTKMAVSTNGHALFASASEYVPSMVDRLVDAERLLLEDAVVDVPSEREYSKWHSVVPESPHIVGRMKIPESLLWHCRIKDTAVYLSKSEVVWGGRTEMFEYAAGRKEIEDFRLLSANLISGLSGRNVHFLWEGGDASPVVFVEDTQPQTTIVDLYFRAGDANREALLGNTQPWFMIVMPLRA